MSDVVECHAAEVIGFPVGFEQALLTCMTRRLKLKLGQPRKEACGSGKVRSVGKNLMGN